MRSHIHCWDYGLSYIAHNCNNHLEDFFFCEQHGEFDPLRLIVHTHFLHTHACTVMVYRGQNGSPFELGLVQLLVLLFLLLTSQCCSSGSKVYLEVLCMCVCVRESVRVCENKSVWCARECVIMDCQCV